ncbi:cardiolipin synthase [Exiguobacterium flavidum]|uniref:cardiolipin synthase n=1 Tax=Exiguobacterium flavidum TaxID=2184695 RepID=UPI000DF85644|nr:cardiolipin synthase [Exiguobacterium flavidum]
MRNRILQFALVLLITGSIIWALHYFGYLWYVLTVSGIVVPLVVIMIIFIENRTAESTIAWFLVLVFLPIIGVVIWAMFGRNPRRRRRSRRSHEERQLFRQAVRPIRSLAVTDLSPDHLKLANTIRNFGGGGVDVHTSSQVLTNGGETFPAILEAIRSAENHVHIQYYIYRTDELSTAIRDALIERAKSGVEVRFMYDGLGSYGLNESFLRPLKEAGGKVVAFDPISSPLFIFTANFRNHRKIVVVDGKVGFTGGLNVGNEYDGKDPKFGFWRDTHLRLEGRAVKELQATFIDDWLYGQIEKDDTWETFANETNLPLYFPAHDVETDGAVQIVTSGPTSKDPAIRNALIAAIITAQRSIWIATPYLVPDNETLTLLRLAARAGLDVRILTPGKGDSFTSYYATRSYFGPLLKDGVKIYTYNRHFMHAKIVLVDGKIGVVGTANMDIRSFVLNYELMAFLYDTESAKELERDFIDDFEVSIQLSSQDYVKRSFRFRIFESLSRLISPLL